MTFYHGEGLGSAGCFPAQNEEQLSKQCTAMMSHFLTVRHSGGANRNTTQVSEKDAVGRNQSSQAPLLSSSDIQRQQEGALKLCIGDKTGQTEGEGC